MFLPLRLKRPDLTCDFNALEHCARSIPVERWIDFINPTQDTALQVPQLAEACVAQLTERAGTARAGPAMQHDLLRAVELVHAFGELPERKETRAVMVEVGDVPLVWLAHIDDGQRITALHALLQLGGRDFRDGVFFFRGCLRNTAELLVIDESAHGRLVAAYWASGIFAELELAEPHGEGIEQQEPSDHGITAAEDELDGFECLQGADDAGQH